MDQNYKAPNNTVHVLPVGVDPASVAAFPAGCVPITQAQADALRAPTLEQAKLSQIATLSAACQAQIYAGFTSNALGAVRTYPAKDRDQQNLTASVLASTLPGVGAGWTTPFWSADAAGTWSLAAHTAAQIQQVGTDAKAAILAAITKNTNLATQVMIATTVAQVQAVVW